MSNVQGRIGGVERHVTDMKKQVAVNCNKLDQVTKKLGTVNAKLEGINGRLNGVENRLVRQDKTISKLQAKM